VYNSENYYKLYDIISIAVWPEYTCLRPSSMQIATLEDWSLSTARGFFFPWKKGHPKRLVGTVDDLVKQVNLQNGIQNPTIPQKVNSIIITGNSGSGKSLGVQSISEFIRCTHNILELYT